MRSRKKAFRPERIQGKTLKKIGVGFGIIGNTLFLFNIHVFVVR